MVLLRNYRSFFLSTVQYGLTVLATGNIYRYSVVLLWYFLRHTVIRLYLLNIFDTGSVDRMIRTGSSCMIIRYSKTERRRHTYIHTYIHIDRQLSSATSYRYRTTTAAPSLLSRHCQSTVLYGKIVIISLSTTVYTVQ